jgi:hypothetical protein
MGSLVMLRNMSGRPGTATSHPVLGLVVTAQPKTIPEHNWNFTLTWVEALAPESLKPPFQPPDKNLTSLYAHAG